VATWLANQFKALGYADVIKHSYVKFGYQLENVVCTKPGVGNAEQLIILCGHYDCIMENPQDTTSRAPGADDNATGMAVILEIARILADVQLEDTVQFVGFSGEEQGLWGSSAYAQYLHDNNVNVHCLINLDEVGYPAANSSIIVERDTGNQTPENDLASQKFGDLMAQMAADYGSTPVLFGPIYQSDYMPFEACGYVVIGLYEGEGNPNYHHSSDVPGTVYYPYVADAARIALATLLSETMSVINESSSSIDVYIRDSSSDNGDEPSGLPHWQSPDIWIRNNPPPADPNDPNDPNYGEDPEAGHQPPINNAPNYLYVRVHNWGFQEAAGLSVKAYRCDPGTGMIWPDHFKFIGDMQVQVPVPPNNNGSVRVGPFIWTPKIVDHECLLAIVSGPGDHAISDIYSGRLEHSLLVRFDNNLGQRNVSPSPSTPGGKTRMSLLVRGSTHPSRNTLQIDGSSLPSDTEVSVRFSRSMTDQAKSITGFVQKSQNTRWSNFALAAGAIGSIMDFPLAGSETKQVVVEIDFSYKAEHMKRYPIVVSQEQDGEIAGRLTIEIVAVKESEDYFYGNKRSRELHTLNCAFRSDEPEQPSTIPDYQRRPGSWLQWLCLLFPRIRFKQMRRIMFCLRDVTMNVSQDFIFIK
jgi:hypothetical protein